MRFNLHLGIMKSATELSLNDPENAGPIKHIETMLVFGHCLFLPGCQTGLMPDKSAS